MGNQFVRHADGAMELIIDLTDVPKKLYQSHGGRFKTFRNCWISGLQQEFLIIGNEPNSSMMGARFRPGKLGDDVRDGTIASKTRRGR